MSDQPSLLVRADRTGWPLLVARVVLGFMFIWMGIAKTGYPELVLAKTGLEQNAAVQRILKAELIELGGPVYFLKLIREYKIFPDSAWPMLNFTAVTMPWIEVLCGVLLIAGVAVRGAAGVLFALLIMFTTMIIIRGVNIYQAKDIAFCAIRFNCGCGGGDVFVCNKIVENVTLILLAVVCLISGSARWCLRKELIPATPMNQETPPKPENT
jgi:uncharacterized membrane protein YphA (DoxX/SURF4 family)